MKPILPPKIRKALLTALKARKNAYAPYSRYKVGAAVTVGSRVYSGANVENASYGATICAERGAILKAVSEGAKKIDGVVVTTSNGAAPCALCLQVLTEFADSTLPIYIANAKEIVAVVKLSQLIGFPFRKSDLKKR